MTRRAEAIGHLESYAELGAIDVRDVGVALGLVLAFDRDEPVLDVDGDPPAQTHV